MSTRSRRTHRHPIIIPENSPSSFAPPSLSSTRTPNNVGAKQKHNHNPHDHHLHLQNQTKNQSQSQTLPIISFLRRFFQTSSVAPATMSAAKTKAQQIIDENAVGTFCLFLFFSLSMSISLSLFLSLLPSLPLSLPIPPSLSSRKHKARACGKTKTEQTKTIEKRGLTTRMHTHSRLQQVLLPLLQGDQDAPDRARRQVLRHRVGPGWYVNPPLSPSLHQVPSTCTHTCKSTAESTAANKRPPSPQNRRRLRHPSCSQGDQWPNLRPQHLHQAEAHRR